MRHYVMAGLLLFHICISGCAGKLPPHGELNLAVKKSFDASGLNYSSRNRITNLAVDMNDEQPDAGDRRRKYLGSGVEILRGFSVNAAGAIDRKAKRSEVIYDLRYDRDNVEVSIKFPMLIDYGTRTIYVGTSFLNTIFETVLPQAPATRGKLIRINLDELLRENSESTQKLSELIDKNLFSSNNFDSVERAVRAGTLRALAGIHETSVIDQPLTVRDKNAGIRRHLHVNLGHDAAVAVALDLIDGVSQALFQDGVISKKEYAALLTLTDKKSLAGFVDKFTMEMNFDVGVTRSGHVGYVDSRLHFADKGGKYQVGFDNVSSFGSYNAPIFTLNPETAGIVDFKELGDAIKAEWAKKKVDSKSNSEAPDDPDVAGDSSQADI